MRSFNAGNTPKPTKSPFSVRCSRVIFTSCLLPPQSQHLRLSLGFVRGYCLCHSICTRLLYDKVMKKSIISFVNGSFSIHYMYNPIAHIGYLHIVSNDDNGLTFLIQLLQYAHNIGCIRTIKRACRLIC